MGINIGAMILTLLSMAIGGTLIVVGIIWGIIHFTSSNEIKVSKPLKPIRVELVIVKNKVDSLYVYEIK